MPTGYTHLLLEKNQTFNEFVWTCVRAFGIYMTMRDEPIDALLPLTIPVDDYHLRAIDTAKAKVAELEAYTEKQKLAYGKGRQKENIEDSKERLEKKREENRKFRAMLEQVSAWTPPTSEHEGMKKFMLEQLNMSVDDETYWVDEVKTSEGRSDKQYYEKALQCAKDDVEYHKKEYEKAVKNAANANKWIADLNASVPIPEHMRQK